MYVSYVSKMVFVGLKIMIYTVVRDWSLITRALPEEARVIK